MHTRKCARGRKRNKKKIYWIDGSFELIIHLSSSCGMISPAVSWGRTVQWQHEYDLQCNTGGRCHHSTVSLTSLQPQSPETWRRPRHWQASLLLQLHNSGPSSIREAELQVGWPARFRDENLLYAMEIRTDGPISCRTNTSLNPLGLQVTWTTCELDLVWHTRSTVCSKSLLYNYVVLPTVIDLL